MNLAWDLRDTDGDAGAFHATDPLPHRSATFHRVHETTLVLGSAQPEHRVRRVVADALGVEVVRRRSGGGGVLLVPDEFVWLDLVIARDDPLWSNDVGKAMMWVGECWTRALASLGVDGTVHSGALVSTQWSRDVCFAGVGTGEVMSATGKLVGVAQRRTRHLARFQTMAHLRWRPELVAALVAGPAPAAADLASAATVVPCSAAHLRTALIAALAG